MGKFEDVLDKMSAGQNLTADDWKILTTPNTILAIDAISRHRRITPKQAAIFWTSMIVKIYEAAENSPTSRARTHKHRLSHA